MVLYWFPSFRVFGVLGSSFSRHPGPLAFDKIINQDLRKMYRNPCIISYRRGKSLNDILVRAKLEMESNNNRPFPIYGI